MLDILKVMAKEGLRLVEKHDFIRIYTHHDPDGITSGAILAISLIRMGKDFQVRFLKGLNEDLDYDKSDLVILSDMGSGYPDVVSNIEADVIVIDHHIPLGKIDKVHINPHLAGLDGNYELSASGTAYVFANVIGENKDLVGLALVGAIGDKQRIKGGNKEILEEGLREGYLDLKGMGLHSMNLRDALKYSLDPFLDFYKKEDELDEFLRNFGLNGDKEVDDLSDEEIYKLINAISLRLLRMNAYTGVFRDMMERKLFLKKEIVKNAVTLCDMINACGRSSACNVAFAICLRDSNYLDRAWEIWRRYTLELLEMIDKYRKDVRESFGIRYLVMEDGNTGPLATIFSRYFYPDKPFVAVSIRGERAKVSARSNDRLRVNLAEVMQRAGRKVGGKGGGHRVAAGAIISADRVEEFISEVDKLCLQCLQS